MTSVCEKGGRYGGEGGHEGAVECCGEWRMDSLCYDSRPVPAWRQTRLLVRAAL